jgi:hypothetical protein
MLGPGSSTRRLRARYAIEQEITESDVELGGYATGWHDARMIISAYRIENLAGIIRVCSVMRPKGMVIFGHPCRV